MSRIAPQYILGLLHPAFISRGQFGKQPLQVTYLRRARGLAATVERGEVPSLRPTDPSLPPPGSLPQYLMPTSVETLWQWAASYDLSQGVSCDVEAAGDHIRAVGFCGIRDLVPLVVPFRRQGGAAWWRTKEELLGAVEFVDTILGDRAVPKVFHFGQSYDIPKQLHKAGWRVEGYQMDTAFLCHLAYPEVPKGLQVL